MVDFQFMISSTQRGLTEFIHNELIINIFSIIQPLNTLNANWASMVIVGIAWSLKAWFALTIPITPRWRERHDADRERVLRMEFRSFVQVPAQILRTG